MLLLSGRAGALTERIGPRLPMTAGPLVSAVGVVLMLRIGTGSSYAGDVLPAVLLFGLGLSLTVAPLTATVLAAASTRHAGVASGINNAVARAAGLVAVAGLPVLAGISGDDFRDPGQFGAGFQVAMLASAVLLVLGGVLAALTTSNAEVAAAARPARQTHCAVDGPPLQADRA
jgi:MFS family permease